MKTKLLFIYGPLGGGGAERVLLDFLANIDTERYEVDLCLMVNQGILLPEVPSHIRIIPLWDTYNLYYKIAYRLSIKLGIHTLFKRVLKSKIKNQYDYTISFLEGMPLKLHAYLNDNSKKLSWVHADLFHYPYTDKQFAKGEQIQAYEKMDAIVCVSDFTLEMFQKKFPGFEDKLKMIYNPVDLAKIELLSEETALEKSPQFTLVSIGRLTEQKRFDRLIRLAARLKKEGFDFRIQIIGEGELRTELENLSKELETETVVEFLGFMSNPFPILKNADLMVSTSASEGFGLVVVEAMALNVPVVATKTAGPTEIIENDQYGLLCEQDDESIYNAVKKLMADENLRAHYTTQGKIRSKDFNVEKAMLSFDDLLETLK